MKKTNENYEYIGGFKNRKFDGKGKIIYKNGDKYEGLWKEGQKEGKGKYIYYIPLYYYTTFNIFI